MANIIQHVRGTAAAWTAANPVLAAGEIGVETDTGRIKVGNGTTAWNSLSYPTLAISTIGVAVAEHQVSHPAIPDAGHLNFYAKLLCGRMMPRMQGPSGLTTPIQPSFFQNQIAIISAGSAAAMNIVGTGLSSVGTLTHPAATEAYGYMTNFASAASANATCGTGDALVRWCRGSLAGGANGFFYSARIGLPDSSYNNTGASTGSRIFAGLTDQTMAVSVGSGNPAGNRIGFSRQHVNGLITDANWMITARDNVTEDRFSTGMAFAAEKVYDFYLFCPPQGSTVFWRIDNVTDGTSAEGSTSTNLPINTVMMRAGVQLQTVNAVARNLRIQRIYVEADR